MIIIKNKIKFSQSENRMKIFANTKEAINNFNSSKSNNLKFLLKQRFDWMNKFIDTNHKGIEVGSGAGFAKFFIKNFSPKLKIKYIKKKLNGTPRKILDNNLARKCGWIAKSDVEKELKNVFLNFHKKNEKNYEFNLKTKRVAKVREKLRIKKKI